MSLFASLGQGDIWALSGISFESPINDLLEKGGFTLENLLEEDELIQEVKAKNERLIEYLSKETTVDHMLDFIIAPVEQPADELRTYKYPYMSCEVICCEVPEILQVLVEKNNGAYLDKLFTFLDNPKRLDYYLAGYFEKILEMLFRRMTVPMMKYLNDAGAGMLSRFLQHIDNYSIMQIVQRLMLPHIPFASPTDAETDMTEEERLQRQCDWSFNMESCELLFNRMLDLRDSEVPLHISDLLITVLQLSPPETLVISFLCDPSSVDSLARAIVGDSGAQAGEGDVPLLDIANPGDPYSSTASVSLAAISVLESLNSRLFEASLPFDQGMGQVPEGAQEHLLAAVREQIDAVCAQLLKYVPRIQAALQEYLVRNPCKPFTSQAKSEVRRLGHRGLQLVKLVESIVRLGNAALDDSFCQCGLLRTCVDLMFHFENNSFLHLSVQRIIITVLESDVSRCSTQRHLMTECGLLGALMTRIEQYSTGPSSAAEGTAAAEAGDGGGAEGTGKRGARAQKMTPKHSSIMGNLLIVAQALSLALDLEHGVPASGDGQGQGNGGLDTTGNSFLTDSSIDSAETGGQSHAATTGDGEAAAQTMERPGRLRFILSAPADGAATEGGAASESSLLTEWDGFVEHTLHAILDHQMVGSYSAIANLSAMSQDDPTKLGVDLEMYGLNGQSALGAAGGLHAEIGAEGDWQQRNRFGEDEDNDEDDDFMFQGPAPTSSPFDSDIGSAGAFQADFDFSKRQNFTAAGFNLETGAPHVVEAFADFAAFGETSNGTGEVSNTSGAGAFADFASFADFGASATADGSDRGDDVQVASDDFAPSVF